MEDEEKRNQLKMVSYSFKPLTWEVVFFKRNFSCFFSFLDRNRFLYSSTKSLFIYVEFHLTFIFHSNTMKMSQLVCAWQWRMIQMQTIDAGRDKSSQGWVVSLNRSHVKSKILQEWNKKKIQVCRYKVGFWWPENKSKKHMATLICQVIDRKMKTGLVHVLRCRLVGSKEQTAAEQM